MKKRYPDKFGFLVQTSPMKKKISPDFFFTLSQKKVINSPEKKTLSLPQVEK